MSLKFQVIAFFVFGVALCFIFFTYLPGLAGPFFLDDFQVLGQMARYSGVLDVSSSLSYAFGSAGTEPTRWLSKASFLLDDQHWPAQPPRFKLTNILFHLLTGLALLLFVWRLIVHIAPSHSSAKTLCWMSMFVCIFWICTPSHISTVLYVVQRMTIVSAFFYLLACYIFIVAFEARRPRRQIILLFLTLFLATLSVSGKENGALLALVLPLITLFLSRNRGAWHFPLFTNTMLIVGVALFTVAFTYMSYVQFAGYQGREFSLLDRLLLQGVILLEYAFQALTGWGNFSVFNDHYEYQAAHGYSWVLVVSAYIFHIAVIAAAIKLRRNAKMFAFGVAWFYLNHIVEGSFLPLELAFEHRNYLPSVGLYLAVAGLFQYSSRLSIPIRSAVVIAALLLANYAFFMILNVSYWKNEVTLAEKWAEESPNSLRSQQFRINMYATYGFPQTAIDLLTEIKPHFSNFGITLQRLRMECNLSPNSPTPVDLSEIYESPFNSTVNHWMKVLIEDENYDCYELATGESFDTLADSIIDMPLLHMKGRYLANYSDLLGSYYVERRNYTKAVLYRKKAWALQPSIATGLKLTELYILGGDIASAKIIFDQVKSLRREISFVPSVPSEIKQVDSLNMFFNDLNGL